jgi:5-methylcytosine-specific restriction endonuclease McrA
MTYLKPCIVCGAAYRPISPYDRGCSIHKRASRSPSTRAQDRQYARNRRIMLKDNPPCVWCGQPATTVDHLIAVANGGSNDLENLVACCRHCNLSRKDNPDWKPPTQTGQQTITPPTASPQKPSGDTREAPKRPLIA